MDSSGRCYDVVDWVRVKPFGGIQGFGMRLLGSIFAEPVLANETQVPLSEFKKKLSNAIKSRYKYDSDKTLVAHTLAQLQCADSYASAIDALPKL